MAKAKPKAPPPSAKSTKQTTKSKGVVKPPSRDRSKSPPAKIDGKPHAAKALARTAPVKTPPKPPPPPPVIKADVLVLGQHPAAYLAAALLAHKSKLRVIHATIPGEPAPDRLVLINPEMFDLHPLLSPMRRKLEVTSVYGTLFLADDPATRSEYHAKATMALITLYSAVRALMQKVAQSEGVESSSPSNVQIHRLDEKGLEVTVGKNQVRPTVLVLGGPLSPEQEKLLGMPDGWGRDIVHRFTFVKFKAPKGTVELGSRPIVPMSLDLFGRLCWGWLFCHANELQLAVEQPVETLEQVRPNDLLAHWIDVLKRHNVLKPETHIPQAHIQSLDVPLAGALAHEGLANRTVLVGPAGGFYSASGEDLYPNVWSALFAADAIKKAFKEPHLQDALQPYRQRWRTTLGDYLRGPQQNLRFLLPLVYRNQVMTTRLAEAILQGKQMVR